MKFIIKTSHRYVEVKEFRINPTSNYVVLEAPGFTEKYCVGDRITLGDVLTCDIPLLKLLRHCFTGEPLQFTPEKEEEL